MKRPNLPRFGEGHDPLEGVATFFDLGIVFALGFLVALLAYLGLPRLPRPGARAPAAVPDQAEEIRYRLGGESLRGRGVRLGSAYRLSTGEVVCVPE